MSLLLSIVFWLVSLFGVNPAHDYMMTHSWYPVNTPQAVANVDSFVTVSGILPDAESDSMGATHDCMVYASLINFIDGSHGLLIERDCNNWDFCSLSFYWVTVP